MTANTTDSLNKYGVCLVAADRGHVWVCEKAEVSDDFHWLTMTNAKIVRVWGTEQGLNSLVTGPRKQTVLDATAPIVNVTMRAVLYIVPCQEAGWAKTFK
jgi:CRISPR/Cas system Type II protein with McrA/HNH and RuvC-like nuclease domain